MKDKPIWFTGIIFIVAFTLAFVRVNDAFADGMVTWDGNGSDNLPCFYGARWNLNPSDGVTGAVLYVNGSAYPMSQHGNGDFYADSSEPLYADPLPEVHANYTGDGNPQLHITLSHCIEGEPTATFTPPPLPTDTPTPTITPTTDPDTPTPTSTSTQYTLTPTNTTPPLTNTPTPTITPTTDPDTPTPTSTGTQPTPTPTNTTPPLTNTPTPTSTLPVITETPIPTETLVPTETPIPTGTPRPPAPADANSLVIYPGEPVGSMIASGYTYELYQGVKAADGTLLLPSYHKGAALYQGVIWVHRLWATGWLDIKTNDVVMIKGQLYKVTGFDLINYGVYPETHGSNIQYIATCYSDAEGNWAGVQLYKLEVIARRLR